MVKVAVCGERILSVVMGAIIFWCNAGVVSGWWGVGVKSVVALRWAMDGWKAWASGLDPVWSGTALVASWCHLMLVVASSLDITRKVVQNQLARDMRSGLLVACMFARRPCCVV